MTQSHTQVVPPKLLGNLFKWVRIFFIFYIISEVVLAIGNILALRMGSIMFGPNLPFTVGDNIQAFGGLMLLVSYVVCVVLFSIFSFRAAKNLHILGTKYFDTSPGWAVGWYFIPIANLWKPYGVMTEIWTGTMHPDEPYSETPPTMPLWWGLWIVTSIAGNVSMRMSMEAGLLDEYASDVSLYKTTLYIDIFSAVTGIVAAWLILGILRSIAEAQDMRMQADAFD